MNEQDDTPDVPFDPPKDWTPESEIEEAAEFFESLRRAMEPLKPIIKRHKMERMRAQKEKTHERLKPEAKEAPIAEWEWSGHAGHLCVSDECRFHLNTRVGNYIISTVGEWLPGESSREVIAESKGVTLEGIGDYRKADYMEKVGFHEVGHQRFYETMVFRWDGERCMCGCQMPVVVDWDQLELRGYMSHLEASLGHMEMCRKYAAAEMQALPIQYEDFSDVEESDGQGQETTPE